MAHAQQVTELPTTSPALVKVKSRCSKCGYTHTVTVPQDIDKTKVDWLAGHLEKHEQD